MKLVDDNLCEITTETIQHWKGCDNFAESDYEINSTIKFKFDKNDEEHLFISEVRHEWWNMTVIYSISQEPN